MTKPPPFHDRPILIAGFGSIGRRHYRNFRELGYERFLFLRSGRSTLDDAEIAGHRSSTDLDELLAERPFAAVIANPSSLHLPVAHAAAEAGCHLLIEKPLSDSPIGCERLLETCRAGGLTVLIGCQFRFHPLLGELAQRLDRGELGAVLGARAEWGEFLPGCHPWEDHRTGYSARADLGGGVVLTFIHPLDYLYHLFGPVTSTHGVLRSVPSLETACEDWADITLQFASGVTAQVHLDYVQRPPVHHLTVWGDAGRAVLDFAAGTLCSIGIDGTCNESGVPAGFERNSMFLAELRHFLDCIERGRPTSIPLEDGIAVLKIALDAKQPVAEAAQVAHG